VAAVAITILMMRRQPAAAVVLLASVFVTFNWLLVAQVLPSFERYKPAVAFSDVIRQRAQPGDTIATFEAAMPSMVFYLQRHVDLVEEQQGFLNMMQSGRPVYVVLPERRYEELGPAFGVRTCVIGPASRGGRESSATSSPAPGRHRSSWSRPDVSKCLSSRSPDGDSVCHLRAPRV
jgi:hypothetical protein